MSNSVHYIEALSSNPKLISATKQCGQFLPGEVHNIEVTVKPKAFKEMESASIAIHIGDARVDIPVKFV